MFETTPTERTDVEALIASLRPRRCGFELIRLGPEADGGYLVPDDLADIAAVFSPGVGRTCGFELACVDRGMKAFLADGSVSEPPLRHPAFSFRKTFVATATTTDTISMRDWIESSGVPPTADLLLQMDIEGAEFDVLRHLPTADLNRFRILVVEFHRLQRLWQPGFFQPTQEMFSRLLASHACVHLHPNNCCGIDTAHGVEIPRTMEFTFLRRDRMTDGGPVPVCPHPLDRDNLPKATVALPGLWQADA
jgi:hypothetical protein